MSKIRKAVIPAAGLGTRMLPASKGVPKEMYPIVDRPAIQFLVEEAVASGITDILIITSRGKEAIESYFDKNFDYSTKLSSTGRFEELEELTRIENLANIYFIRQKEARGLGHAVLCAKNFVGNEPFAVLYGDDMIISETPVCKQLADIWEEYEKPVVGVKEVPTEKVMKYCSLKTSPMGKEGLYAVSDMIEKPKADQIFSNFSILGRVILPPEIFNVLENTAPGAGGEIQLTDAMAVISRKSGLLAYDYEGKRYDMGSKLGFITANIDVGLNHPETAQGLKEYLKSLKLD
jgi:UTP--glucose-1-phosphate uridylyltransferase